ncbi:hypothetical protein [Parvularcula sp. IMCC14364]|uniref:hypothetical protein n=1 Tax=Parvularcula sp. IMCC14364 TaxID=3067902 RepID=UPI0027414242|nr:hypothetical protein [Parvularcula sp. IMCC14364]
MMFLKLIGKSTSRTLRNSSGNYLASTHDDQFREAESTASEEPVRTKPAGLESLLFRQLERPRLQERTAPDMSLDEARFEVAHAERFYAYNFSLFPRGDFFYEEVEQEYLHTAMGLPHESTDARFIRIMTQFRRVLNDNSRRLFLYYTPLIFALCLTASLSLGLPWWQITAPRFEQLGASPEQASLILTGLIATGIYGIGLVILLVLYHWPYKVTQQRNLLGLDNYITSKFSRVNQNFLVSKRRALNVERNKRMTQADELREEAGIWTLAYNWFATRLLLCEQLVRNKIYQIRRNTTLYGVGGIIACSLFLVLCTAGAIWSGIAGATLPLLLGLCSLLSVSFIALAYSLVMGQAMPEIMSVMHASEWSRFNQISLDRTIADHVGEDKLQIVTFRDRNRFE